MANCYPNNGYVNLFTTRAHVFQVNPTTKNTWISKSESAIPVSFVATLNQSNDNVAAAAAAAPTSKRELKIVATNDDGETVLESVILQKTIFSKRAQKFGQWSDHTGQIYGLGFNSETEMNTFVETFQELQRSILEPPSNNTNPPPYMTADTVSPNDKSSQNWNKSQEKVNNMNESNGRDMNQSIKGGDMSAQYSNTLAHSGHQQAQMRRRQLSQGASDLESSQNNGTNSINNTSNSPLDDNGVESHHPRSQSMFGMQTKSNNGSVVGEGSPDIEGSSVSQYEWQFKKQLEQKTYENERLKQALEESSKNAGVWHNELLNLRTNNVKLTQALQESKAHVEEWERELLSLRDENKELKLKIMALESANSSNNDLQNYVEEMQGQLRKKDFEIEDLQKSMEQLELKASQGGQNAQTEDSPLDQQQRQKIDSINAKLEAKIDELAKVQKELAEFVDKLNQ